MAAAAPTTLSPSAVPGVLSAADRAVVADGFNALGNVHASPPASGLRIVDLLDSRFIFTISHPRRVNLAALRALSLKLKTVRRITLDLPRAAVRVECWRTGHKVPTQVSSSRKRKRNTLAPVTTLPPSVAAALQDGARAEDEAALQEILLYVLNREEHFCTFDLEVRRNEAENGYSLAMGPFDAVSLQCLSDLCAQWRTLVRDVHVDWGTQSVVVHVQM